MAKIKIIYGSAGGNTEVVCERAAEVMQKCGDTVEMLHAKLSGPENLGDCDLVIFASPTYGHGQLEQYFQEFLDKLEAADGLNLEGRKFAVIGLGDPKYDTDYHLEAVKTISDFLKEKKAIIVGMPLRISKSPYPFMADYIPRWAEGVSKKLAEESGKV